MLNMAALVTVLLLQQNTMTKATCKIKHLAEGLIADSEDQSLYHDSMMIGREA